MQATPGPIRDTPNLFIPLADGCQLAARVWMPESATDAPVPAILEYIPYRKRDGTLPRDETMHPYMAARGYACIRVDLRGTGDSDGILTDEYTQQELADACEVIGWLAAQPWCSGSVGMMGKSWGGFNGLQTAALRPPALKAVVTVCSSADRFEDDIHFKGGCLLGENVGWGAVMLSYSSRPPDPDLWPDWRAQWLRRLEADQPLAPVWAGHQARDDYWKHGSVCEDWSAIAVPVLSIGGWADNYMNTVSHLVRNLAVPVQGIVGPWVHQYPHMAVPGPRVGFLQIALRWWDRWLKGIANGAEGDPAYRAYVLHSAPPDASAAQRPGHWVAESTWPSARVTQTSLALSPRSVLGGPGGALDRQIATPQTLGLAAGEFFPMGLDAEMPADQAGDDARAVCFETPPLVDDLQLFGAARLTLRLMSDKPKALVIARLCDVAPDGSSVRIAHGMLNLCHRDSREAPSPVPMGQPLEIGVTLDQMAYRLARGHRLRLSLSTTYWPFVWPSPEAATLTLLAGTLDLPCHDGGTGDDWVPPPAESGPAWRHRVLRAGTAARRVETDLIGGRVTLVVETDEGDSENLDHGLVSGGTMSERWSILPDDPLSARAEIAWQQRLSRGDWSVRTEALTTMWGDATHLHFHSRLTAWEGETVVHDRSSAHKVPRDFV
ncbi:CocE/NonD family hydrolase [Tabrizicola piscis]|uniref:CocE/NonD family hydrolase n=1 Tax=Tabrizicola piscis TaxID=2494374 RepID=A0A3S8UAZ5_9RHOB|nr:CocE/NonD family hydrolase [Tabrizicola piscis]AZL60645.1 CocE/NonD family hydrolase [Tabrizicola piscis]